MTKVRVTTEGHDPLALAHSERFRKVSTRYPRRVAEAYNPVVMEEAYSLLTAMEALACAASALLANEGVTAQLQLRRVLER